jgi:hypothetical protein
MPYRRSSHNTHALAAELADRCANLLSSRDWRRVNSALGEMHEQPRQDIPDVESANQVFAELVAHLIERLGNPDISSMAQARVYDASADSGHRECATAWIKRLH